ncbi:hypothetical protein CCR95_15520 [Thiocystis minor]|uniref:sulfatase-like hydrolase/transferase n=1 Tax=Thiocystis minor TaxID=61597 RepID=UPI001911426F|nr:sulfatase-like hydrolase/transferase [Thiocystis minor]MBK5965458.1 hypothetical protein [Thiocystis minor]
MIWRNSIKPSHLNVRYKPTALIVTLSILFIFYSGDSPYASDRPNIILVLADDVGWGDVASFNPNSLVPLPSIERLASEGVRFTDAHTSASKCAPSRYSIITGNYQWRGKKSWGQWNYKGGSQILSGQKTLGDILSQAGYVTAIFGKYHLGGDFYLKGSNGLASAGVADEQVDFSRPMVSGASKHGFDYSFLALRGIQQSPYAFFENDRLAGSAQDLINWTVGDYGDTAIPLDGIGSMDWNTRDVGPTLLSKALNFIDDHASGKNADSPFFIYFNTEAVHDPWKPPARLHDRKILGATGLGNRADMLVEADVVVEQLLESLTNHGLADNTIVIFTSDNGGIKQTSEVMAGHDTSGGLRSYKGRIYEGGHRVPLIIKWGAQVFQDSSIRKGARIESLVGIQDLFATFAELVGVDPPANQGRDSVSILPLLLGSTDQSPRDHMIQQSDTTESGSKAVHFAYRSGSWKLVLNAQHNPIELYNLSTDIKEKFDLIDSSQYSDLVDTLTEDFRAALIAERTTPPAGGSNPNSPPLILQAVADSYTLNSAKTADSNYGQVPQMKVHRKGEKTSFIRFDLASLSGSVNSATLKLSVKAVGAAGVIRVYRVRDAWSEREITANHLPAIEDIPSATFSVAASDLNGIVNVNITELARAWKTGTAANWGVALKHQGSTTVDFRTRETANGPSLTVTGLQ